MALKAGESIASVIHHLKIKQICLHPLPAVSGHESIYPDLKELGSLGQAVAARGFRAGDLHYCLICVSQNGSCLFLQIRRRLRKVFFRLFLH